MLTRRGWIGKITTTERRRFDPAKKICCNTFLEEHFMRPCLLFMLALVAVVAIAICGPPAVVAGSNDYQIGQTAAAIAENPATSPAQLLVVADPPSTAGRIDAVAIRLRNILPAARPRNIFRQWVRLLTRLSC